MRLAFTLLFSLFFFGATAQEQVKPEQNEPNGVHECKLADDAYLAFVDGDYLVVNSLQKENREADFWLYNAEGKEVLSGKIHFGINQIKTSGLPKGTYLLKVKNQRGVFVRKVLIGN